MKNKRLTPKETVHAWCHYCIQSRLEPEVASCGGQLVNATRKPCDFFPYRKGKRISAKVIRRFCLECMGGSSCFVKECEKEDCPMHSYRFGRNPFLKGVDKERMAAIRPPRSTFCTVKTIQNQSSGSR